jgi:hypothetical protein
MNRPIIPLFAIANNGIMDVMVRLYRGLLILYPAESFTLPSFGTSTGGSCVWRSRIAAAHSTAG